MVGEGGFAHGINKFDGTDYAFWKMQIKDHLYGKKLHLPLLGAKPKKMSDEDLTLLDRQVLGVIRWEHMRAAINNSTGNVKLKFTYVRDKILIEEVRRKDLGEITSNALNVETRGKGYDRNSNRGRGRSKSRNGRSKSRFGKKVECLNCGNKGHIHRNFKATKKEENNDNDVANVVIEEVQDALLLSADNSIDSWVLDLRVSFHTSAHRKILEN
ncbi:hypothetical protein Patl1_28882 [Pistacia atlantica]|uniref:Uncharacterized protein n=1 Tax=Pistacia atlantica TaxID=434234 RepID=A0ACC1BEW1_9ROSI|nr:hypothetical protein Patl1_28882 [Pistacia atlantica]